MISVRKSILEEIEKRRISAILRAEDRKVAADAMRAAIAGGFRMVEFTLTTPGALELISAFSAQYPDLIVGAGTVMTTQMATDAAHSGARFLVSPICDPEMITAAKQLDVVAIPGAFTPTEMIRAHLCGADLVKLFPAPADVARYITSVL
ncbi:MAG: bifunctional 4-hydroxy-2-oxoglutarate aldolase/2-dehydro-3-deoxy-phosphogluconate aldolase, partial [Fidelibacterota bacterium]